VARSHLALRSLAVVLASVLLGLVAWGAWHMGGWSSGEGVALPNGVATQGAQSDVAAAQPSVVDGMRGTYANPVYLPSAPGEVQRIDVEATLARLATLDANAYAYQIAPLGSLDPRVTESQWRDLPRFADEAKRRGISVLVYLVPPSEAAEKAYAPFGWDYTRWAANIGALAAKHTAIRAIVMDDFGANTVGREGSRWNAFTPQRVDAMRAAARARAGWLEFIPVLYYTDLVGAEAILSQYRDSIDAVVMPYSKHSGSEPPATVDASTAYLQGRLVANQLKCPVATGCLQATFARRAGQDPTSDVASAAVRVQPRTGAQQVLKVRVNDDRVDWNSGRYSVDVAVDGAVVSSQVVSGPGWREVTVNLTPALAGKSSAMVDLRLVRKVSANRPRMTVLVDGAAISGLSSAASLAKSMRSIPGRAVSIGPAPNLPLAYMSYAARRSADGPQGAAPTYVYDVLRGVETLRGEGRVDGSLVYNLNLSGDPRQPGDVRNAQIVRSFYERWTRAER